MLSRRAQRLWLFGTLIWVTLAVLSAAQNATWRALTGRPVAWLVILPNALADWLTCGMFTPAFYLMVRRFPSAANVGGRAFRCTSSHRWYSSSSKSPSTRLSTIC